MPYGSRRRLCPEVVRIAVDNDGPANNVFDVETVCHHRQIGSPTAGEQRREIPHVQRVVSVIRIIVAAGIGKIRYGTASPLMNMKCKETCVCSRQATDFCNYHCPVSARDKLDCATHAGICVASMHTSDCCGVLSPYHILSPHSSLCDMVLKGTFCHGFPKKYKKAVK